jgi:hypothetical protein
VRQAAGTLQHVLLPSICTAVLLLSGCAAAINVYCCIAVVSCCCLLDHCIAYLIQCCDAASSSPAVCCTAVLLHRRIAVLLYCRDDPLQAKYRLAEVTAAKAVAMALTPGIDPIKVHSAAVEA